jgi:phage terminase large subunit
MAKNTTPSSSRVEKTVELHDKQLQAFESQKQFTLAVAGVRGGKTFVGAVWAGDKIMNVAGDGLITAPDFQTLRDATLATFFQQFPKWRKFYKEQKHVIEFPSGKKIFLRSMDDPLSAEGLTVAWVWGDEAGKYKILAWHSLRSRVSLTKGPIFLTTTPYNMGWLYTDFFKIWEKGEDVDYNVVQWDSVDNPYFPKEVFEAEKKRLSKQEFDRRYRGHFARMQGLVYNIEPSYYVDVLPERADMTIGGIDWGWAHNAALLVVKLYQGVFTLSAEWYQVHKTTPQIIEAAIQMQNTYGVNRWYADSANPEKIAEANYNTGLHVLGYEKKKDSLTAGIDHIRSLFLDRRLFIIRGLQSTTEEFDLYQYPEQKSNGPIKDEPIAMNNHLMDAMRYAIMGYQPARRVAVPTNESYTTLNVRRLLSNNRGKRIKPDSFA